MNWRGHGDYGARTYPAAEDNEAVGSRLRLDLAVVAGWTRHELAKIWRFAAPPSEDFLPLVLDREADRRAAWAKRETLAHGGRSDDSA